jgi:DNA mismatch repair ATPase MutS
VRGARAAAAALAALEFGEYEALVSLASYADEHPGDPFPEIAAEGAVFSAEGLGHPLLPETECVRNDLRLGGADPHLLLLSGSNMSGKSTLLRAVGANAALALSGAPVRARRLRISPLQIASSLRADDSLLDGKSRFFAEILRLRDIVERAEGAPPVLFLLDELLSGTNSSDRARGAEGILRGLVESGAIGLCTTHDLALTRIAAGRIDRAQNAHFGEVFSGGALHFDFKLKPGVVRQSNALELMRAMGLRV